MTATEPSHRHAEEPTVPRRTRPVRRSLQDRLRGGDVRAAVTFAGQGLDPFDELGVLLRDHPSLVELAEDASAHLGRLVAGADVAASGHFRHGLDIAAWLDDPGGAPDATYRSSTPVSLPLVLLTQLLSWRALQDDGIDDVDLLAATGHSQGILAAICVAESPRETLGIEQIERYLTLVLHEGLHIVGGRVAPVTEPTTDGRSARVGPMVAVGDIEPGRLQSILDDLALPSGRLAIALRNTASRSVVAGPPEQLAALHRRLDELASADDAARRAGRLGGAPLRPTWNPLPVEVPFHSPALADHRPAFAAWLRQAELLPDPTSLRIPVLSPLDGRDLRGDDDLADTIARSHFVEPVDWPTATAALVDAGADWILDVGPGTDVARMSAENVRGTGVRVLALASPEGRRVLLTPGASPEHPDVRFGDFAPGRVRLPDGSIRIDNAYTRATGRPPVILAGMTPTTVDAPIVAAAANAGYPAELAGGGQPTAAILEERFVELTELLDPGVEVSFNTLLLDRHLWNLHVGRDRIVERARRRGIAIGGITVSAGVPEVDEAVDLIRSWASAGMTAHAFKCGTVAQVRQILAIAEAVPDQVVQLHLEGGLAGGHHSWEDLEELLLTSYGDMRRVPNVLVCAGGGVAHPERAAELVTGSWALRHGRRPMPVDAVLIGTAAMACREATASPGVKAALVAATGSDGWVHRRAAAGGVSSSLSSLRADIHLLDNAGAAAANLVDELGGDATAITARHDEIVDVLSRTAKPYFGDLRTMSAAEVLARFVELAAIGGHGRYDDGAWLDPSWRARALQLFRRYAARLATADRGEIETPIAVLADLDDPAAALASFLEAFPDAAVAPLHPTDVDATLTVFAGGGKPVNFVPVIDAELRRWYLADALWQAQHERYDADGVVVIPGPAGVAGITAVDEPIAELLARFETGILDAIGTSGIAPVERDRVLTGGVAPGPLRDLGRFGGPLAAFAATPSVVDHRATDDPLWPDREPVTEGSVRPNPLWRLVHPGDELAPTVVDGVLTAFTARPTGADDRTSRDAVHARIVDPATGTIEVRVELANTRGGTDLTATTLESGPGGIGPFTVTAGTADRRDGHRVVLGLDGPRASGTWRLAAASAAAYRTATGAQHDGMPIDLAFTLAWPALATALVDGPLVDGLDELVHEHHGVRLGSAWPPRPEEGGAATARFEEIDDDRTSRRVVATVVLRSDRGEIATVAATLRILRPHTPFGHHHRTRRIDRALAADTTLDGVVDLLVGAGFDVDRTAEGVPAAIALTARTESTPRVSRHLAIGTLTDAADAPLLTFRLDVHSDRLVLDPDAPIDVEHPADSLLARLAPLDDGPVRHERPRRALSSATDDAPASSVTFAVVGGDHNPLHRSHLAARTAGLDAPILHGMWTSARASALVVDGVCGGHADRLREWSIDFVAPLALGAPIEIRAERAGVADGAQLVAVTVTSDDVTVALGTAVVDAATTAWCFPGQGTQHQGMGTEVRSRSAAAAATWAEADRITRERLGFSIIEVVDDNPTVLRLADGTTLRHPSGVLFLTELTQVALTTMAAGQLAELRNDGVLGHRPSFVAVGHRPSFVAVGHRPSFVAVGHSAGEFNALMALGVLPLDACLELVFRRGRAMQLHVPRDTDGTSPFRLAVVNPSRAGIDQAALADLLRTIAQERHKVLEFANHNARGRQHAVTGHAGAIAALTDRLGDRAVKLVDGIDVPFHSSVLAPAVDDLREALEALVPATVDHRALVGRWVPNLTGFPFELEPEPGEGLDDAARRQLIDLLAAQLASPVRWIEVQDALFGSTAAGGLGVERMIEVGPERAPVLSQLAAGSDGVVATVLHSERDHALVRWADADPDVGDDHDVEETPDPVTPVPATVVAAPPGSGPVADRPFDAAAALLMVLANQAMVRLDQISGSETIEELFQGASSRRNQVLIDLGREFDLSGVDGAHEQPITALAADLAAGASRYRFPGGYLRDVVAAGLSRALGRSGMSRRDVGDDLQRRYGLGPGLVDHVVARLVLGARTGPSARGGAAGEWSDAAPASVADARRLLDAVVAAVGADLGLDLRAVAGDAPSTVDAAATAAITGRVEQALVGSAHQLLDDLGRPAPRAGTPLPEPDDDRDRLGVLDAALGASRSADLAPRFDARRHVRLASAAAMARWDLVATYHQALDEPTLTPATTTELERLAPHGIDPVVAATVGWYADRAERHGRTDVAAALRTIDGRRTVTAPPSVGELVGLVAGSIDSAADTLDAVGRARSVAAPDLSSEVAVITGASPGSIAADVLAHLLRGGATVVATTSALTLERRRWFREIYRRHAGPGAELHLFPANLASFDDIDALVAWLADPTIVQRSRPDLALDPLHPTLVVPFAAVPTVGDLRDSGAASEVAIRVQLLGVERLVSALGAAAIARRTTPVHVLLPLSPNHGAIGGDGPYAETKAALEVLLERRRSEASAWGDGTTVTGARIGWVRGTNLTAAGDAIAERAERELGIRTFDTAEMGWMLATLCAPDARSTEVLGSDGAVVADLTGGFGARAGGPTTAAPPDDTATPRTDVIGRSAIAEHVPPVRALPAPPLPRRSSTGARSAPTIDPADLVVIVGAAELGPCGPSATRFEIERRDSLSADGIVEIAWLCGLVRYERDGYRGRWIDAATDTEVPEHELADRYAEVVGARVGLRPTEDDGVVSSSGFPVLTSVHLERDLTFDVASEADARAFVDSDPDRTEARQDPDSGEWSVTRLAGSSIRVPRRTGLSRRVAGQFPTGLDLGRFGLSGDLLAAADRMALVNLACTAGAFDDAGLDPEELMTAVHPVMVANTQGSGQGGMVSSRRMLLDLLLGEDRQPDRLQEALVNVVAAHAVQGYVGSYGSMVHPVAACATAAVSLEEAHDKIRAGKALVAVAGGYDDLTPEGVLGFGDMGATVSSDDLDALGIMPCEASRSNDLRRRGFVESQGGGAFLVMRGDVALELGLPVRAVLAYAGSFADGIHTSIPAPGMGALASAMGGVRSPLATALGRLGLDADDIGVISKHDTSTEMNDPNEADLHQRIQTALGRTEGNPLLVVSQKTVTGHAKGGAAAWQVAGVLQMMETGIVPGNRTLESLDPLVAAATHLAAGHTTLQLAGAEPLRAALVTSLGFGHVSALLALAHPDAFLGALDPEERDDYLRRADERRLRARQSRLDRRAGRGEPLRRTERRIDADGDLSARDAEAALLLDPSARLGPDGVYRTNDDSERPT